MERDKLCCTIPSKDLCIVYVEACFAHMTEPKKMKIQFLSVEVPKTAVPILDMLIRLILAFGSFAIPFRQVANHLEGSLRLPPSQLLPSEPSPSFCPPALRGNASDLPQILE